MSRESPTLDELHGVGAEAADAEADAPLSSNPQCEHMDKDSTWTAWFHSEGCPWCQIERLTAELAQVAQLSSARAREILRLRAALERLLATYKVTTDQGYLDFQGYLNFAQAIEEAHKALAGAADETTKSPDAD